MKEAMARRGLAAESTMEIEGALRWLPSGSVAHRTVNRLLTVADGGVVRHRRNGRHEELGPDALQDRLADCVWALEEPLSPVKQHQGVFLPICARCRRIRNDGSDWEQLETYVAAHSEARLAHGTCPECWQTVGASRAEQGWVSGA